MSAGSNIQQNPVPKKKCPACQREFPVSHVICDADGTLLMIHQEDNLIGAMIAEKYRILEEVGRGGMSVVYKGLQEFVDREVAIKMLNSDRVSDQNSVKRFQQEAKAASLLNHENIIKTFDFGIIHGRPYLVMDFLRGQSLADVIKNEQQIDVDRAISIFVQACDALAHAHRHGVIHRDLKSSNIMLVAGDNKTEQVKVVDFGIAKLMPGAGRQSQNLTQTGEIFGSPIYMSPEQCLGHPLDARSDIYSMGTMIYEALTGYPPLMGKTIVETMEMQCKDDPKPFAEIRPDLDLPLELEKVVFRSLAKKPDNRYPSMEEFRDALRHVGKILQNKRAIGGANPRSTLQNIPSQQTSTDSLKVSRDSVSSIKSVTPEAQRLTGTKSPLAKPSSNVPSVQKPKPFYEKPITFIILGLILILVIAAGLIAMKMQNQI
ncbi:MAG TPA: serine/threonine-protein kinase [Candidatus Obscuribacterales bacterium]